MNVLLVGDTHGNTGFWQRYVIPTAHLHHCKRIFQLGDFGYWEHDKWGGVYLDAVAGMLADSGLEGWWLDGNHENHTMLRARYCRKDSTDPVEIRERLYYCPRGCLLEWEGVRILTCGGGWSIDEAYRVPGKSWWPEEMITDEEVERCIAQGKVDILLSHDAPGSHEILGSHKTVYSPKTIENRKRLTRIVNHCEPTLNVHGHWHVPFDRTFGTLRIVGLDCDQTWKPEDAMALLELPSMKLTRLGQPIPL